MQILEASKLTDVLAALPAACRVVATGNAAAPWTLLRLFDAAVPSYRLHMLNPQRGVPDREGVILESAFVGPGARSSPRLHYIPARLSMVPRLFATALPVDVVLVHTSAPIDGTVSLGPEVNILPGAIEAVRARGGLVIAQLDRGVPYIFGDGVIPFDQVDLAIEAEDVLGTPAEFAHDDATSELAAKVAHRISDGVTIQLGIGQVPDAVLGSLTKRRGLKVWSEMVSDGILNLERSGALDPDVVLTASFLLGSPELYSWAHLNPRLRLVRSETTNDPARIAANPGMVSVNTALQVDLFGQVNASRIGGRIYSGFGGSTDYIVGALHAAGGQALIALRSWHPRADVSTVIPLVDEPVTSFQPSAVITENGVAELWARSESEQAEQLIEAAAHPRIREELWEEAAQLGLTR